MARYGYGSIPIHTIFSGMNIHLPAILMWTTGVQGFDTLPYHNRDITDFTIYGNSWGRSWSTWINLDQLGSSSTFWGTPFSDKPTYWIPEILVQVSSFGPVRKLHPGVWEYTCASWSKHGWFSNRDGHPCIFTGVNIANIPPIRNIIGTSSALAMAHLRKQ